MSPSTSDPQGNQPDRQHVTVAAALRNATERLRGAGISETPALDAEVLLGSVTGMSRAQLRAYSERLLTASEAETFGTLLTRRLAHEPAAYLTGHREFMGLDFLVDARVLVPRPETELLVEDALREIRTRLDRGSEPVVADIGTGSGAIAVSIAALERRLHHLYATDISADALALARENAERLGVAKQITFLTGDLLDPIPAPLDIVLANLPYVARHTRADLPRDVSIYEPAIALYGEDDGLGHFRRFFQQAPNKVRPGAVLMLEFGYDQRQGIESLAVAAFPQCGLRFMTDYSGWDRYVVIHVP